MSLRVVSRAIAVLIAVFGVIDPVLTLPRRIRQPLVIAVDGTFPAALTSAARAGELLQDDYDVRARYTSDLDPLPACAAGESCIVVGGGRWSGRSVDADAHVVGAVRVSPQSGSYVAITSVTDPTAAHVSAVGHLQVELTGHGVAGQQSTIDVLDGDVPVGRAVHTWANEGPVTIPVEWWPMAAGPRRLSIRASRGETSDGQINVGVDVGTAPYNVLVYDTRPSPTAASRLRTVEDEVKVT